jgi:hypothetical protein
MRVRSARSGKRAGGSQTVIETGEMRFSRSVHGRSATLRDGLRRKELILLPLYPALTPTARKRASARPWLTSRRA